MAKSKLKASYDFGQALVKAGVLTEEQLNLTERVVIDIHANNGVKIYIQQFGEDGKMAHLSSMLPDLIDSRMVHDGE